MRTRLFVGLLAALCANAGLRMTDLHSRRTFLAGAVGVAAALMPGLAEAKNRHASVPIATAPPVITWDAS
jgi:hypothetical protein